MSDYSNCLVFLIHKKEIQPLFVFNDHYYFCDRKDLFKCLVAGYGNEYEIEHFYLDDVKISYQCSEFYVLFRLKNGKLDKLIDYAGRHNQYELEHTCDMLNSENSDKKVKYVIYAFKGNIENR